MYRAAALALALLAIPPAHEAGGPLVLPPSDRDVPAHIALAPPAAVVVAAVTSTRPVQRRRRAPRAVSGPRSVEQWRPLVARYPWPVETALRVIACESGGRPDARNSRSSATGLFQILRGSTDPEVNVGHAYRMWTKRGWRPWASSRFCWQR